ncbi:hypothetical protein M5689_024105 [Euphorbia peplus]|nr:hypothetical protein M5689_024105 [Euphorbia peplus]
MDRDQDEMQFMGILDIYKETHKIILTWIQIFIKITLTLIVPLSFIFLAHIHFSDLILSNITELDHQNKSGNTKKLHHMISKQWAYFLLLKAAYFTFFFIFSLLSTAAVVYTVASIYTRGDITFRKVMSVVPKVWKRLMFTFIYIFVELFLYNMAALLVLIVIAILTADTNTVLEEGGKVVFGILYFLGMVYLSMVFQLGSVVSVLEDACDYGAIVKSRGLIKGKMVVYGFIFYMINLFVYMVQFGYENGVVHGSNLGMEKRVLAGIIFFLLIVTLFLFGLVVQTVIYFVCKSFHQEHIDKTALSLHLEDYVSFRPKDVQLSTV